MAAAPWQWSRRQFLKGMIAAGAAPYLVSASALGAAVPPGEGWTMAGANPARTSWVPEEVAGRLRPVWYRAIEPYISQNVQIIATDGKVFIATARGLYALKAADGETAEVRDTLKKLLAWRAANFSKDTPFQPKGPYNKAQPNSHANRINLSRNFIFLTPELAQHLHEQAQAKVRDAVEEYNRVGPYWFVSRYEGCLQEATVQNLHDYFALFQAKAWILKESREELVKYLDVPGFQRGDCFYIHNLVSTLEARPAGAAPSQR